MFYAPLEPHWPFAHISEFVYFILMLVTPLVIIISPWRFWFWFDLIVSLLSTNLQYHHPILYLTAPQYLTYVRTTLFSHFTASSLFFATLNPPSNKHIKVPIPHLTCLFLISFSIFLSFNFFLFIMIWSTTFSLSLSWLVSLLLHVQLQTFTYLKLLPSHTFMHLSISSWQSLFSHIGLTFSTAIQHNAYA